MKILQKFSFSVRVLASILAVVLLAGCRSTGNDKGNAAAESMQTFAAEVQRQSQALDASLATLTDLVNKPSEDINRQFKSYNTSLDRLYSSIERTEKAAKRMRERSGDYFEVWDRQLTAMNYDLIRDRSQARKQSVSKQVEATYYRYIDTREVVLPLLAYLEDIRKALNADLTPGGLESVKDIVKRAEENGGKVQNALAQLGASLADFGNQMSFSRASISQSPQTAIQPQRAVEPQRAEASNR